jgi:hypothetical protein
MRECNRLPDASNIVKMSTKAAPSLCLQICGLVSILDVCVHILSRRQKNYALKEAALAKLKPCERGGKRTRFQPNDRLLAFLEAL